MAFRPIFGVVWTAALDRSGPLFKDPEIVAMICPRPLQIQVADKDELFPVEGARREAPSAARYYQELGCGANFEYVEFEGTHEFFGPAAWQFLDKFL